MPKLQGRHQVTSRAIGLGTVALALSCCTTSYRSAYAYRCGAVSSYGLGTLAVARWIGHDLKLKATVLRWEPQTPKETRIHMQVQWAALSPNEVDLDRAILTITYRLKPGRSVLDPAPSSLELIGKATGESTPHIKAQINHRKSSDVIELEADWLRVRQLGKLNGGLTLIARNTANEIVETIFLPAKLFYEAPRLKEHLQETQIMPEFPELLLGNGCERDMSPRRS